MMPTLKGKKVGWHNIGEKRKNNNNINYTYTLQISIQVARLLHLLANNNPSLLEACGSLWSFNYKCTWNSCIIYLQGKMLKQLLFCHLAHYRNCGSVTWVRLIKCIQISIMGWGITSMKSYLLIHCLLFLLLVATWGTLHNPHFSPDML